MALTFAADSTLARYIKSMASRATSGQSTLTPAEQSVLFMSALAAAGNIGHESLRLTTIKWVNSRSARVDFGSKLSSDRE